MHCGQRRKRRRKQRGGILPFLIPLLVAGGKAIAAGTVSGAAGYGAKKSHPNSQAQEKSGQDQCSANGSQ